MMHNFRELAPEVRAEFTSGWPWTLIGVFPTEPDDIGSWFDYTVGLGGVELFLPCASIEGRCMDNNLCGTILNVIAGGWRLGLVHYGDEVAVPLGISDPDGAWVEDRDAVFWLPTWRVPSRTKQVFQSDCPWTVPMIWSSPLGFADE